MISTVLLCPPKYYQIEYEINPWMHVENKVDYKRVQEEFDRLVEIYKKLGLNVLQIDPQPGFPDMVYAANFGFVIDDIFIRSNFRFPQRRKESYFAEEFFHSLRAGPVAKVSQVLASNRSRNKSKVSIISSSLAYPSVKQYLGVPLSRHPITSFKIQKLPENIFFEGQGDMFYRDGKFFCGYGKRTMKEAIPHLEKILGDKLITIEVNDPYYYHLDTCFSPLGNGRVVIKPTSFKKEDVVKIKKNFKKVIEVGEGDNSFHCCNIVAVGDTVVTGKGVSRVFKSTLQKEGFKIIETPMDEFFKGGGSVKCLTLEFFKS